MSVRVFLLGCAVSALAACGGCGPKIHCTIANCSGCCDADGACQPGSQVKACGSNAAVCAVCPSGQGCFDGGCGGAAGGGTGGSGGGSGGGGTGGSGGGGGIIVFDGGEDCSAEAKLVYVVDQDRTLSSFDPAKVIAGVDPFVDLGQLACPSQLGAQPFSMSLDRNAVAWIVYDSGELFTVNVKTLPLACTATSFTPQQDVARFGMGFVSNDAGSNDETLFIAGSPLTGPITTTKFGTLGTVAPYTVSVRGMLSGAPELTGTGDAKLWAFFPNVLPPRISQLDKASGAESGAFAVSSVAGDPRAWAFAFWGGDFWIFLKRDIDNSTNVWRVHEPGHTVTNALPNTGRTVVGAGVSTCAPLIIN